jgi:uncharacterized protein YbbC (DUF1343 family)
MSVRFGIDQLLLQAPSWKQQRIGMLTNDAAKTWDGIPSRKALLDHKFNLVQLFSPEHGLDNNGKDGAFMRNDIDPLTNLPIISLYGDKFAPEAADLENIDVLLFDVPDAGTRFYTFLWSMTYFLEAASKFKKKIVLLDRPNPLSGNFELAEGPMLDPAVSSFIGRFSIPVKHQATLGELALYFNHLLDWKADIEIVKCSGWKRWHTFFDWGLPWVKTSPAIQNFESCLLYPGLCFFESTNVSIGRDTAHSFEWIGAPWLKVDTLTANMNQVLGEDLKIESLKQAVRLKVKEPSNYKAVMNGLIMLKLIKDIHQEDFKWAAYPTEHNKTGEGHLTKLLGIPEAEQLFELPLKDWLQQISKLLRVNHWQKEMEPFLLYA